MDKQALLVLEDGSVFHGRAVGCSGVRVGEVVFNTALSGYQEILSDPSYAEQIVTLTYPHIGNVGCNPEDMESSSVYAKGLIVRDVPTQLSNWRSTQTLSEFLHDNQVVAIADIDTRHLTKILREKGALRGCLMAGDECDVDAGLEKAKAFPGLAGMDLAQHVTTQENYLWNEGSWALDSVESCQKLTEPKFRVAAYDYGIKNNILRLLVDRDCEVAVYPAMTDIDTVLASEPDGVFLSNGPGDPEPCDYAISAIKTLLEKEIPTFGICLGCQLLGLAAGAKTQKMKFGHHGANHPVQDLDTKQVFITSQNHGFALDEGSLPDHLQATHRSLFDQSLQGIKHTSLPAYGFQGHPEASPGPHDIQTLFDPFIALMQARQSAG